MINPYYLNKEKVLRIFAVKYRIVLYQNKIAPKIHLMRMLVDHSYLTQLILKKKLKE